MKIDNGLLLSLGSIGLLAIADVVTQRLGGSGNGGSFNEDDDEAAGAALLEALDPYGFNLDDMGEGVLVDDSVDVNVAVRDGIASVAKMIHGKDGDLRDMKEFGDFPVSDVAGIVEAIRKASRPARRRTT